MKILVLLISIFSAQAYAGIAKCGETEKAYVLVGAESEQARIAERYKIRQQALSRVCDTLGLSGMYLIPDTNYGAFSIFGWNEEQWRLRFTIQIKNIEDLIQ